MRQIQIWFKINSRARCRRIHHHIYYPLEYATITISITMIEGANTFSTIDFIVTSGIRRSNPFELASVELGLHINGAKDPSFQTLLSGVYTNTVNLIICSFYHPNRLRQYTFWFWFIGRINNVLLPEEKSGPTIVPLPHLSANYNVRNWCFRECDGIIENSTGAGLTCFPFDAKCSPCKVL